MAQGGGGAALTPSPKYPGCSSPPRAPLPPGRGGAGEKGGGLQAASPPPPQARGGQCKPSRSCRGAEQPPPPLPARGEPIPEGPGAAASPRPFIAFFTPSPATLSLTKKARRCAFFGGYPLSLHSLLPRCSDAPRQERLGAAVSAGRGLREAQPRALPPCWGNGLPAGPPLPRRSHGRAASLPRGNRPERQGCGLLPGAACTGPVLNLPWVLTGSVRRAPLQRAAAAVTFG